MGLDTIDTLLFPFNLFNRTATEKSTVLTKREIETFKSHHWDLLLASSAKYIFVCEGIAENCLFDHNETYHPFSTSIWAGSKFKSDFFGTTTPIRHI